MNNQALDRRLPAIMQPQQPKRRFAPGKAPIVPPGSVTGRSLTIVIAIMGFLACLTAGAVYMVNQSAAAWLRDVGSEVTVQVSPEGGAEEVEKRSQDIAKFLTGQIGVREVQLLSLDQSAELVEPWLGQISAVKDLPLPRLIAVQIDRENPPDLTTLRAALTSKFPAATLDDHRAWQQQIRRVTGSLALGGIAVIILDGHGDHRRRRFRGPQRHGLEPRNHRSAQFRRRRGAVHRAPVRIALPQARHQGGHRRRARRRRRVLLAADHHRISQRCRHPCRDPAAGGHGPARHRSAM